MNYLILFCFLSCIAYSMNPSLRVIGKKLHTFDEENKIMINRDTSIEEKEIVAVNVDGKWVYGWVQYKPNSESGIWLGIVNSVSPIDDTYGGRVRQFKDVRKLPSLQGTKISKTE